MVRKATFVKLGYLHDRESHAGVRVVIVAMKRGNSRGAKGGREVDTR